MLCETGTSTTFCKLKNIQSKDVGISAKINTVLADHNVQVKVAHWHC